MNEWMNTAVKFLTFFLFVHEHSHSVCVCVCVRVVPCSQNRAEYERRVREQALKFRDQSMA